jgi:hypothetical protein
MAQLVALIVLQLLLIMGLEIGLILLKPHFYSKQMKKKS